MKKDINTLVIEITTIANAKFTVGYLVPIIVIKDFTLSVALLKDELLNTLPNVNIQAIPVGDNLHIRLRKIRGSIVTTINANV